MSLKHRLVKRLTGWTLSFTLIVCLILDCGRIGEAEGALHGTHYPDIDSQKRQSSPSYADCSTQTCRHPDICFVFRILMLLAPSSPKRMPPHRNVRAAASPCHSNLWAPEGMRSQEERKRRKTCGSFLTRESRRSKSIIRKSHTHKYTR